MTWTKVSLNDANILATPKTTAQFQSQSSGITCKVRESIVFSGIRGKSFHEIMGTHALL